MGNIDFLIDGEGGSYISVRNCFPLTGGPKCVPVRSVFRWSSITVPYTANTTRADIFTIFRFLLVYQGFLKISQVKQNYVK